MTELLERADALHTLQQQLRAAHTRGRVALVSGEAGAICPVNGTVALSPINNALVRRIRALGTTIMVNGFSWASYL